MKQITVIALFMSILTFTTQAQDWGFGFKVGLNTSGVIGPSEVDADGNNLETFGTIGGFQVGGLVQLKMNKYYGFQTELLFSQKGTDYKYEGASFNTYTNNIGSILQSTGNRKALINATNGHINIPLLAYVNVTRNLNLSFGGYMDILVSSSATGETEYSGTLDNGSGDVAEHLIDYTFNYFSDEAGERKGNTNLAVVVGSESIVLPGTEGAYYHFAEKQGRFYNPFDFGLVGDIGWRFDNGLRFDLRVNYGMTDVTNNYYDFSSFEKDANGDALPRTDFDRSVSYQLTIGFGF